MLPLGWKRKRLQEPKEVQPSSEDRSRGCRLCMVIGLAQRASGRHGAQVVCGTTQKLGRLRDMKAALSCLRRSCQVKVVVVSQCLGGSTSIAKQECQRTACFGGPEALRVQTPGLCKMQALGILRHGNAMCCILVGTSCSLAAAWNVSEVLVSSSAPDAGTVWK